MIKREWDAPKIVHLKEYVAYNKNNSKSLARALDECSFENYSKNDAEKLWKLSKAVWTDDIIKYFPTTDEGRVFFAAEGELLVTGIEYLPFVKPVCEGDSVIDYCCVDDLYNVYRLTSTRMLVVDNVEYFGNTAAIFGGLDYHMSVKRLQADKEKYSKENIEDVLYAFNDGEHRLREVVDGIQDLIGTQREADSIVSIINKNNIKDLHAVAYMSNDGTEAAFKNLSGTNQALIHVATHGFFYNKSDSIAIKRLKLGDDPLSYSGLIFAGADNKWFGDDLPEGV